MLGVCLGITFEFPFKVKINTDDVGGPSAGTMFALAVYDTLTPGSLTGGKQIAGTGTIDPSDGTVGPIGGIAQKLVGARDGWGAVVPRPGRQLRRGRRARPRRAAAWSRSRTLHEARLASSRSRPAQGRRAAHACTDVAAACLARLSPAGSR